MLKYILLVAAMTFSVTAWAQSSKKPSNGKTTPKTEQKDNKNGSKGKSKSNVKDKAPADSTKTVGKDKNGKTSTKTEKKKPEPKIEVKGKGKTEKVNTEKVNMLSGSDAFNVEKVYQQFPIEYLPMITDYINEVKAADDRSEIKDGKDLRKGFIMDQNAERGYLNLQKPGESRYTRLQLYKNKESRLVMAVETEKCLPYCEGTLKFYEKNGAKWDDATTKYFPKVDDKYILSKLKEQYKKVYTDLEIFNSRGYDNPETLHKSLIFMISPDDNKILVQEQYLHYTLYEMTWNESSGKFTVKKS